MTTRTTDYNENKVRKKHVAIVVALVLALLAAVGLALDVEHRLQGLGDTASEDGLWAATRGELALRQLQAATDAAIADQTADLSDVRVHMQAFADRFDRLQHDSSYRDLRTYIDLSERSAPIAAIAERAATLGAADDATLRAALPGIAGQLEIAAPVMADFTAGSRTWSTLKSEADSRAMSGTIYRMAATALSLVVILSVLAVVLIRLSRRAQEQAQAQHDAATRLQKILETSLDAVLVFDKTGRIAAYNGAAEHMFGYTQQEAIGAALADLVIPEDRIEAFHHSIEKYARTGESRIVGSGRLEMEARRRSGEVFPVELSVDRIADRNGAIFVSFVRDITERRTVEASLVDARDKALAGERAKAEFLAVMSHEMRTPLNGLLGSLSLLRDTALTGKQRTYLGNMEASGHLLMHHVNDVLELSKLEAGKMVIAATAFDPGLLLNELIEAQRSVAEANGNDIGFEWLSDPVPAMQGDPVRIRQVLLNLISNAIKFTRQGAIALEVEVTATGADEHLEFRVIDTGIGIAEENIGRIFGDFETLDSTYGRSAEGTGLGLSISRRLTEAMGGEIGVDSIEGEGSIFWVRLPLVRADLGVEDAAQNVVAAVAQQLRILIVEDNQINRVVLRDMLTAEGHDVTEAINGQEGVDLAAETRFDLILTDISMPVMDGVQATRAIRAGNGPSADVPILAVTAHALPDEIQAFRAAGMNDTIGKPIDRSVLRSKLAGHCGAAAPTGSKIPCRAAQAPKPARKADTGPVDTTRLRELMDDLGPETAQMLLDRFIRETDATFDEIDHDADQPVIELVPRLHKIAGSAAALGASKLHSRLGHLEALGKSGKEAPFRAGLSELAPIWAATRQHMVNATQGT